MLVSLDPPPPPPGGKRGGGLPVPLPTPPSPSRGDYPVSNTRSSDVLMAKCVPTCLEAAQAQYDDKESLETADCNCTHLART